MARPSTPLISRDGAAKAALDVIDEVGLASLSLDRVAKKLKVRPPSLYHYFKDKAELLEEVARLLLSNLAMTGDPDMSYEERLVAMCLETRRALLGHPNAAMLILQFFPRHMLLNAYEAVANADPYPPEFHMAVIEGTEKLTFGSALFAAAAHARDAAPFPPFDPSRFPAVARAVDRNPFDEEHLFEETLRMFLAGVADRYRRGALGQRVVESKHLFKAEVDPAG